MINFKLLMKILLGSVVIIPYQILSNGPNNRIAKEDDQIHTSRVLYLTYIFVTISKILQNLVGRIPLPDPSPLLSIKNSHLPFL